MFEINPYITDILAQPAALRQALEHYPASAIEALRARLQRGDFNRIVLTGMGSSYNGAYPAWLQLTQQGVPAVLVNSAELLHYGRGLLDERTLLWMNSQSGRSVEIVRLIDELQGRRPAFQLSMSNYLDSPLALSADLAVPIHAGAEATVSTKTYINMLALLSLAATQLTGENWQARREAMLHAADAMEAYLANWQQHAAGIEQMLGEVDQMVILGRGASLAAVWNGSLIQKEAAKCAYEGMNVADFRHGPMELASPRLTVLMLEGAPQTAEMNRQLAREVVGYGGKAIWLGMQPDTHLPTLCLPQVDEAVRPLVEILPLQMLTLVLAARGGFESGKFRHIGKVTVQE